MRASCCVFLRSYRSSRLLSVAAILYATLWLTIYFAPPAQALPSFARQTGQPCGTCHTDFPSLTPYGRRFKLLGYTAGGGQFRTTPFSSSGGVNARAELDKLRGYAKAINPPAADDSKVYVPPVSLMAIVGYTHTQAATVAPPTDPYKANDNVVLSPFSAFWGGAITDHVGAFAQVTYSGPDPLSAFSGTPADQFKHTWSWDNADVRFASTGNFGPIDFVYGITANNNPTVQDLWNTTPAWSFPYAVSSLAGTPGASTMIEGAFAARVGGVGAYTSITDLLYLEFTAYKTLGFSQQNSLGMNPFDGPGLFGGVAPYWRVALEPHWGRHSLMAGTFGMYFDVHPWLDSSFATGTTATLPQSDRFTDIGFDTQYQYQGDNYWLTLRGSYIREFQRLDASFASLAAANPTNLLNSMKLQASFAYGNDNRIVLTGQYFNIWGTADAGLFGTDPSTGMAMTPNSSGWTAEVAYIPFSASKSIGWPWFNARIGLQYTYYNKFDGTTIGAHDNNTLFLHAWLAM
ncbi:cytochrome C [Bradyrhizobium oligotrophicum]|uniref:cytochrome C n=1 Tax=Bradyrhizobium oligotrophicum TaxID=44255 RepID=UPI003EB819B0